MLVFSPNPRNPVREMASIPSMPPPVETMLVSVIVDKVIDF
jgi:hypothetical protein